MYLKLTSQEYDMVFVSLTIKVLDAITAVKKYRDAHTPKTAPVIIAVASSITSDIKASCYAAGMNGYVLKPVKATDLAKLDALILKSVP
jgi:CheY-like chemotaxis protein